MGEITTMKKMNVSYEPHSDDLFIFQKGERSKETLDFGDFVVDINEEGKIIAVEFLNASDFLSHSSFDNRKITPEMLERITDGTTEIIKQNGTLIIKISMIAQGKEIKTVLTIPVDISTAVSTTVPVLVAT